MNYQSGFIENHALKKCSPVTGASGFTCLILLIMLVALSWSAHAQEDFYEGYITFDGMDPVYDESDGIVELLVYRYQGAAGEISVDYSFDDGTATAGKDYGAQAGTLYWASGDSEPKPVEIEIFKDAEREETETFDVFLSNAQSLSGVTVSIERRSATVSITDNTNAGELHLELSSDTVLESAGQYSMNVQRLYGSDGAISVDYEVVGRSATADTDFVPVTGTLSWGNAERGDKPIVVPLIADNVIEPDEQFLIRLLNAKPSYVVPESFPQSTITILDDSEPPVGTVSFAGSDAVRVTEGNDLSVVMERSGGSYGAVSVTVSTVGDTAQSDIDFTSLSQTIDWADGVEGPKTVVIAVLKDRLADGDERFFVRLSNPDPAGLTSGNTSIEVTIVNDIGNPGVIRIGEPEYNVREDRPFQEILVRRVDGDEGEVRVNYATRYDTADEADFSAVSGTLVWVDGDSTDKPIRVAITRDSDNSEDTERFYLTLSGAAPYGDALQLGSPSQVSIFIENVPVVIPPVNGGSLSFQQPQGVTFDEDAGTVSVQVERQNGSSGEVSVDYELQENTATAGEDFMAGSGTLTWLDGDSESKTITITINADSLLEGLENFTVQLINPRAVEDNVQVSLAVASLQVSIADTSNPGSLRFASVRGGNTIAENSGTLVVEVERIGGGDGPVSVDYILVDRGATPGTDVSVVGANPVGGNLTWQDNDISPKSITLMLNADAVEETSEDFAIQLVNPIPTGITIIDFELVLTIQAQGVPEDGLPRLRSTTDTELNGIPGQILEPMILVSELGGASNTSIEVEWRVSPEGAVEFLQGNSAEFGAVTQLDDNAQTGMQVRVINRGFIQIIASPVLVGTNAIGSKRLRSDPPLIQTMDGDVLIVVRSGFAAASGLNGNQAETGGALDAACQRLTTDDSEGVTLNAGQQDLLSTCQKLQALESDGNTAALARALDRLAPEEVFYFADSLVEAAGIQITNIYSRINAIRNGKLAMELLDLSNLQLNISGELIPGFVVESAQNAVSSGGSASADDLGIASQWGVFANGELLVGTVDGNGIQRNSDLSTSGITLGADYRMRKNVVIGAGLGFTVNNTDFTGGEGEASSNGMSVSLFGTWYESDQGYADVVLDAGNYSYDMSRRIDLPLTDELIQFADGGTDASTVSLTVGVGRDFNAAGWDFGPYGRMSVISGSVDGYSEKLGDSSSPGSGSLLDIRSHSVQSTRFSLGAQISRIINTGRAIILPQVRMEMEFEREDRKDPVEAVFQNDPTNTTFEVTGNTRDRSYVNLGVGSSFVFRNGRSAFVFYETRAQHDYVSQHALKLGLRFEF